jgi:hypothetical protein
MNNTIVIIISKHIEDHLNAKDDEEMNGRCDKKDEKERMSEIERKSTNIQLAYQFFHLSPLSWSKGSHCSML